jgi:transcriptional regulator with XRE-family HTH domain
MAGHYIALMNRMREFREARGLRREDVASRGLISYEYVRRLETEDPPVPTLGVARRIAGVLGVTVDQVFPEPAPRDAA